MQGEKSGACETAQGKRKKEKKKKAHSDGFIQDHLRRIKKREQSFKQSQATRIKMGAGKKGGNEKKKGKRTPFESTPLFRHYLVPKSLKTQRPLNIDGSN